MPKGEVKKEKISGFKKKLIALKNDLKQDISVPVIASLGFIIALIWRDAIRSTIDHFLSSTGLIKQAYIYDIISAIIVTVMVVVIMIFISRISRKNEEEKDK
ncbi:MAG: DUF5654 family protein [Nanoarchaeota archaeon]|jgi:uncharacterized membrane protein|nr:DUF5654 family protein [Nanoarchaeota archaeon]